MTESSSTGLALLVMDVQEALVGMCPTAPAAVQKIRTAVDGARSAGVPVVFSSVGLRAGHAGVSDNNLMFTQVAASGAFAAGAPTADLHAATGVTDADITFVKRRVSAFTGSDLSVILSSLGVRHLVLTGLFTSGVVLATLLQAADLDYRLTVLSDACADPDDEVHQLLVANVFPARADVVPAGSWNPMS